MKKAIVIISLLFLIGCVTKTKQIVLHPIEKTDIFIIPQNAIITIPAGTNAVYEDKKGRRNALTWDEETVIITEKQGRFISDYYLDQVVQAKHDAKK